MEVQKRELPRRRDLDRVYDELERLRQSPDQKTALLAAETQANLAGLQQMCESQKSKIEFASQKLAQYYRLRRNIHVRKVQSLEEIQRQGIAKNIDGRRAAIQLLLRAIDDDKRLARIVETNIIEVMAQFFALKDSFKGNPIATAASNDLEAAVDKIIATFQVLNKESATHEFDLNMEIVFAQNAGAMSLKSLIEECKKLNAEFEKQRKTILSIAGEFEKVQSDLAKRLAAAKRTIENVFESGEKQIPGLHAGSMILGAVSAGMGGILMLIHDQNSLEAGAFIALSGVLMAVIPPILAAIKETASVPPAELKTA